MVPNNLKFIFTNLLVFSFLILPLIVLSAGDFVTCDGPVGISNGTVCDLTKLLEMINKVISYFAFRLTPIVAAIAILLAGLRVVANPDKVDARTEMKGILYSVVLGLVIVFSAYLVVQAIIYGLASTNSEVGNELRNAFK